VKHNKVKKTVMKVLETETVVILCLHSFGIVLYIAVIFLLFLVVS